MQAYQLKIVGHEGPQYYGAALAFILEVRDLDGRLTNPSSAPSVQVFSLDGDAIDEQLIEGTSKLSDAYPAGVFLAFLDSSKLPGPDNYAVRFNVPYEDGKVISQEVFMLRSMDSVEAS